MANVKISELNSLTKKANDDLVPIVDTSANETKKISIQDLINNNVSLIAVSGVAPDECATGDKYFNTTDNLIYTATDTDTWSSTGESPIEGIFYIVFEEQTTYAYNGTTLVSVGGGAGSGGGDNEPIGKVVPMVLETAPDGYLLCDGSTYTKAAYPDLYKALRGTQYIIDTNSFRVPDIKGKVIVGKDSNDSDFDTIGFTGGSKELQEHSHQIKGFRNTINGTGETIPVASFRAIDDDADGAYTRTAGTGDSGNLQPYIVLNYFIKAQKLSGDVILSESLPVGTIVGFDGSASDIPVGWEAYGTGQIKKVAPTTSLPAQAVNTYSNSDSDTYSCEYINGLNTYSTIEKRVGTWINNKPIYRKVLEVGSITGTDITNIALPEEVDTLLPTLCGMLYDSAGNGYPINYNNIYNVQQDIGAFYQKNSATIKKISLKQYAEYGIASGYIIVEYTKTTDNTNTRNLQESKKSVSEDYKGEENFEDIEPIEEPIENKLEDENR